MLDPRSITFNLRWMTTAHFTYVFLDQNSPACYYSSRYVITQHPMFKHSVSIRAQLNPRSHLSKACISLLQIEWPCSSDSRGPVVFCLVAPTLNCIPYLSSSLTPDVTRFADCIVHIVELYVLYPGFLPYCLGPAQS